MVYFAFSHSQMHAVQYFQYFPYCVWCVLRQILCDDDAGAGAGGDDVSVCAPNWYDRFRKTVRNVNTFRHGIPFQSFSLVHSHHRRCRAIRFTCSCYKF